MTRGRKTKNERTYKNPNGFGTVYELKTGNRRKPFAARITTGWDVITVDGKPHKRQYKKIIGYAETYDKAVALLTDYHRRKNAGMEIVKNDASFDDVYQITVQRRLKDKSVSLRNVYNSAYKYLSPIIKTPLTEVKVGNMQKCIDDAYDIGKSSVTLANIKMICKMVFEYGIQNDLISKDYSSFLKVPKTDKKISRMPFSQDEIKTLWESGIDNIDTILILIYTGIRINELLKTKISDVHITERYFITGSKTDAGRNRIIPIALPIFNLIKKRYNPHATYLIESNGKKMTSQIYRTSIWDPIMKNLDMQHLPHDCRHTFCTITDNAGMNRVSQQKIIGHKGLDVTESVYIHKSVAQLLEAIDAVWPKEDS